MSKSTQVKTEKEIEIMKQAGQICAEALRSVIAEVKVGVSCAFLDGVAEKEIESRGASSSFKTVDDYQWTICTTINEQVVHGIPTDYKLKGGDILGIDIGAYFQGFHSDMAISVPVGNVGQSAKKFLDVGRDTLKKAISKAMPGARIGDISQTIGENVEKAGYLPVKILTGHGVGRELHDEPMVPCFGKSGTGPAILENMVLAIEVIYTEGSALLKVGKDNWTFSTKDGSLGGLFEQTIAVSRVGHPIVLTPYL